jgi:hypothetical protein
MKPDEFDPIAKQALIDSLPDDLNDLLTEDDKAKFAEWSERNRRRQTRIAMETGVHRVG